MLIIPAIDIKDGRCVRLKQGQMDKQTIYSDQPVAMAERWIKAGSRRLHIVDLDGALNGRLVNADVIDEIVRTYPDIPIQVGGGIRDRSNVETYLEIGVSYVVIGTKAIMNQNFISDICLDCKEQVIVSLDSKNGKLATNGWVELTQHNAIDIAKSFEDIGIAAIVFTDINRDGMLSRVNIDATAQLCQHVNIPVIASGGISSIDDIRGLCEIKSDGLLGAIVGRALYEQQLDFAEIQTYADKQSLNT